MTLRRLFLGLVLTIVAVVLMFGGLFAWAMSGLAPVPDGYALPGGGRIVQDGYSSVVFFETGDGRLVLVDAGLDPGGAAILAELGRRGLGPEAVAAILLTHGHPDHVAGCAVLPQADVYVLAAEVPLLQATAQPRGPIPALMGVEPSPCTRLQPLQDGDDVRLGDLVAKAYAVPGHTAGSSAWLISGVLLLGDSADHLANGILVGSKWMFSDDTAENARSLRALVKRLDREHAVVDLMVFSHTGPFEGMEALRDFVVR